MILKEMEKVQMQLKNAQEPKKKQLQKLFELMRRLQNVHLPTRDKRRKVTNVNEETMYNKEANLRRISKQKDKIIVKGLQKNQKDQCGKQQSKFFENFIILTIKRKN